MYEYTRENYVYNGNNYCGTPIREIKTITDKEARYWDNLEKQIRNSK